MDPLVRTGRPSINYDAHRAAAARMRAEVVNGALSRAAHAIVPRRPAWRNAALALLLASGALWIVMVSNLPRTVAANPALETSTMVPGLFEASLDLSVGNYVPH